MVHDMGSQISTVQQAQEFLAQGYSAEILLTNLGAVGFRNSYGPLTLNALWGPAIHTGLGMGQTIGAITVGGRFHLLHTNYEPAIGLLREASSLLNAALRQSPDGAQRNPGLQRNPGSTRRPRISSLHPGYIRMLRVSSVFGPARGTIHISDA
jgi:hypothetical protein